MLNYQIICLIEAAYKKDNLQLIIRPSVFAKGRQLTVAQSPSFGFLTLFYSAY